MRHPAARCRQADLQMRVAVDGDRRAPAAGQAFVRLARQPRDLEDLIDLVEYYKRPVETVTGQLDLRASNGRARLMTASAPQNPSQMTLTSPNWPRSRNVFSISAPDTRAAPLATIRKSRNHGPSGFDYSSVEPIWRDDGDPPPDGYVP